MTRTFAASLALALLLAIPAAASAQRCLGLPGDDGSFTYGFEGTDGAEGEGFALSVRKGALAAGIARSSLEMFTFAEPARTWELRGSVALKEGGIDVCAVTGARTTGYLVDRHFSTRRDPDTGHDLEEHRVEGEYARLRVPLGLGFGGEFRVRDGLGVIPFLTTDLLYQQERLESSSEQTRRTRSNVTVGGSAGLTLRAHRFLLRTVVHHVLAPDETLSGRTTFPGISAHLGISF